jgi:pimeloyl-ACP methyl ester carboxylesterase
MKLRAVGAVVCAVLSGAACAAPGAVPTSTGQRALEPPAQGLTWQPCPADPAQECAALRVPIDWSAPRGRQTTIQVTRMKATGPARPLGVLVSPPPNGLAGLSPALRERFDLVTYTKRALEVVEPSAQCVQPADVTFAPRDAAEFQHLVQRNRAAFLECARRHGESWHHLDSATEARDVDAVRAALDQRQISFLDTAATNLVGQAYVELFPGRVRALVLDGGPDHSLRLPAQQLTQAAAGMEATFQAFADWCARTPECGFHGMDLRGFYRRLGARAENSEFTDLRGFPFDFPGLATVLEFRLSAPHLGWFDMAERLREISAREVFGRTHPADADGTVTTVDGDRPGPVAAAPGSGRPAPAELAGDGGRFGLAGLAAGGRPGYPGSGPGSCLDWDLRIGSFAEVERLRAQMAEAAPVVHIHGQRWEAAMFCAGWPFDVPNPAHRLRVSQPVAALVAFGAFNPDRPVRWGEAVAAQIPGARKLFYAGPGASTYHASPCARDAIDAFLITGTARASTTCPAIWP